MNQRLFSENFKGGIRANYSKIENLAELQPLYGKCFIVLIRVYCCAARCLTLVLLQGVLD